MLLPFFLVLFVSASLSFSLSFFIQWSPEKQLFFFKYFSQGFKWPTIYKWITKHIQLARKQKFHPSFFTRLYEEKEKWLSVSLKLSQGHLETYS